MFAQSLTGRFLKRLFEFFSRCGKESFFIGVILGFFDWIEKKIKESRLYDRLGKKVFYEKYYSDSLFYSALNGILKFVCKIFEGIRGFFRKIFAGSLSLAVFEKIFSSVTIEGVLALFIGVMLIAPHELWNNLYAVMAAFVFAIWALSEIAAGKKARAERLDLPLTFFVLAIVLSTVTAIVFSDALRISVLMIAAVILAVAVYFALDTREKLVKFVKTVLFFTALTGLYAIAQRIMGVEVDLEFVDVAANEGMPGRVYSTFSNPNNFAEILILFMPFFVPLFMAVKRKTEKTGVLLAFIVCVTALAMTYSRSCWVGFALSAVLFVVLFDKRLIIPAIIFVIIAIPFLPKSILNRIFTIGSMQDSSNSYRTYIWTSCLQMIKRFGLTGLGIGPASFKAVYPDYAASIAITAPHSHMLYMELVLETGLLGFLSFFAYIYTVVKRTAGAMRRMDKELKTFAIAGLSSLLGIAFVCCAEYVWFYPRVMFAFWMVPALCLAVVRITKREKLCSERG